MAAAAREPGAQAVPSRGRRRGGRPRTAEQEDGTGAVREEAWRSEAPEWGAAPAPALAFTPAVLGITPGSVAGTGADHRELAELWKALRLDRRYCQGNDSADMRTLAHGSERFDVGLVAMREVARALPGLFRVAEGEGKVTVWALPGRGA